MPKKNRKYKHCQNCNHQFNGVDYFCPNCGQKNQNKLVSFKQLVSDFLGDYFNFDTKFFTTLKPLIVKPGFLTNEYNSGHRVKYLPPIRLYIFISVAFFFILTLEDKPLIGEATDFDTNSSVTLGKTTINLNSDRADSLRLEMYNKGGFDSYIKSAGIDQQDFVSRTFTTKMLKAIYENRTIGSIILSNISVMALLLLPVFALLLMLVYFKRKKLYISHLVFSLHFHAFLLLVGVTLLLVSKYLIGFEVQLIIPLVAMFYLFFAMKNVYGGRIFPTFLRMITLFSLYLIIFIALFIGTSLLSIVFS